MLTSGTTGRSKRVQRTYRQLETSIGSAKMPGKVDAGGRIVLGSAAMIISTPLVHIGGLWHVIASVYGGPRTVLLDRFTVPEWVDAVDTHRPRAAGLVPAAMQMLIDADIPAERLASLQVVTSGTAPCPPALADTMLERYSIRVLMTAGRAFPGVKLRVVGDAGGLVGRTDPRAAVPRRGGARTLAGARHPGVRAATDRAGTAAHGRLRPYPARWGLLNRRSRALLRAPALHARRPRET